MVAVVVPMHRFCSYSGCTDIARYYVLDSQNRQWGAGYCRQCAEKVRKHINDAEQTVALDRLGIAALMPGGDR